MGFRCGCGHTHTHKHTRNTCMQTHTLAQTVCAQIDWQINSLRKHTYTHAQTCAKTHLYLARLLFCVFPPSQTSKRRIPSDGETTILQSSVLYNAIFKYPPLTTCRMSWRNGGFKQIVINTQHIPPTANKICMGKDNFTRVLSELITCKKPQQQWLSSTGVCLSLSAYLFCTLSMFYFCTCVCMHVCALKYNTAQ